MKSFFNFLLCFAIGLAVLVGAIPTPDGHNSSSVAFGVLSSPFNFSAAPSWITEDPKLVSTVGYDPSNEWHDYSTVQVWVGRTLVTVGDVVGSNLYSTVYNLLDRGCKQNEHQYCDQPAGLSFTTNVVITEPFGVGPSETTLWDVRGQWDSPQIRRLLIGAVAGTLEALTNQPIRGETNCFDLPGRKACNVGDIVRVNMPKEQYPNFMHVRIANQYSRHGNFNCCGRDYANSRGGVDKAIDSLGGEIIQAFDTWWDRPFTRDSRCIINGWHACPA